jgi:hypothetical protein
LINKLTDSIHNPAIEIKTKHNRASDSFTRDQTEIRRDQNSNQTTHPPKISTSDQLKLTQFKLAKKARAESITKLPPFERGGGNIHNVL